MPTDAGASIADAARPPTDVAEPPDDRSSPNDRPSQDSGSADVTLADAGSADVANVDAASTDAMSTDAMSTDATNTDVTSTDAASTDAASTDATSTDAGSADAGSADAASADAGSADAASADVPQRPFGEIYRTILVPRCADCHGPDRTGSAFIMRDEASAYRALVNVPVISRWISVCDYVRALPNGGSYRVRPSDPASSMLYFLPSCYVRDAEHTRLTSEEREVIRGWILRGAPESEF